MPSIAQEAWALLEATLSDYFDDCSSLEQLQTALEEVIPAQQRERIAELLATDDLSYRDGLLLQLAYKLTDTGVDATAPQRGGRTMAQKLGKLLAEGHVRHVHDAFENIGKGVKSLRRGVYPTWDDLLLWLNEATPEQLEAIFRCGCCHVASTARPVLPMPKLDTGKLTFAAVMSLYERLLETGSEGVHEQFIVASLLDALVNFYEPAKYRVETKPVFAADRSSQVAGDVQIKMDSRVMEAYEVTAAGWETKLHGVRQKLREHDLTRMHVVAPLSEPYAGVVRKLIHLDEDVSVIDLRGFASVIVSGLTREYRARALVRMYELLDRVQRDIGTVNAYVEALFAEDLILP